VTGLESAALNAALREAVAEQVLVAGGDGRLFFRHALLREALYDDLLPGERGELHLRLAQAFEWRATDTREVELAALVASHYDAAGDQPAALRSTIRAALAARRVHAYGETADLAERALELWPRVPEPVQTAGIDQVEVLVLAAGAHGIAGDRSRAEVLLQSALRELDSEQDPRRYSAVLARLARTQWSLNRGLEGVETAQRALSMLPAGEESRERASLLAWLARTRVLRGRFRDAVKDGREALAAAVAAGDTGAEGEVLNTLGMAQIALGQVEEGSSCLREAIAIARENDDVDGLGYAYANLADSLNLAGRMSEALDTAREGMSANPRRPSRERDWMTLVISELEFETGDWELARSHLGPPPSRLVGVLLIFRALREAELADDFAGGCGSWERGTVAVWLRRTGSSRGPRRAVAEPYQRQIDGDWAGAARLWQELGCPYEAAMALLDSTEEDALREALQILTGLLVGYPSPGAVLGLG